MGGRSLDQVCSAFFRIVAPVQVCSPDPEWTSSAPSAHIRSRQLCIGRGWRGTKVIVLGGGGGGALAQPFMGPCWGPMGPNNSAMTQNTNGEDKIGTSNDRGTQSEEQGETAYPPPSHRQLLSGDLVAHLTHFLTEGDPWTILPSFRAHLAGPMLLADARCPGVLCRLLRAHSRNSQAPAVGQPGHGWGTASATAWLRRTTHAQCSGATPH